MSSADFGANLHKRGRIVVELTVWCAFCPRWDRLEAVRRAKAHREAKARGWHVARGHSWVCPPCAKALHGIPGGAGAAGVEGGAHG